MINESNQNRIKSIYQMLLEMALGNLNFRIPLDGSDLQFDELAAMLNNVAEKMYKTGYLHPQLSGQPNTMYKDPASVIMEKVQDYILNHLEEPLPSSKELAKLFRTNEFALKESFRNLLNTSIYQFYNDERLKRAHHLIQQTVLPLKEIAFMCGFNDYANFLKAFKKKYNYTPSEIERTT